MTLTLYAHPFAAYCWKVLIALYENQTPFTYRQVESEADWAELETLWPLKKFPLLLEDGAPIIESSVIIEYLDQHYPGTARLVPEPGDAALKVRFMDRFFDNYVMTPMQKQVGDLMLPAGARDPHGVARAIATLDTAYRWLNTRLQAGEWAAGIVFTLADCAAAPALFYADWVHPIGDGFPEVAAYRARLLAHPSVARVVEEARPYRRLFPAGAPDRD